jgi:xylan 1,4-beta-xylosidase
MMIHNPVLPGFRPDPSIVRVGDDYFIANSTFEWCPGIALSHSKDLVHWRAIGHVITRPSQLDLRGVVDSAGTWAPSLSHDGKLFHLVVASIRTRVGPFKDMRVLLFTAPSIEGPWSDPVSLGGCGFDPSLFHDDDGRKWLANIQWDYRKDRPRFAGIVLQEYDPARQALVGEMTTVLTKPQLLEGPNLYKRNGLYYIMCAEGGTGWNHGISMARARTIRGPYEPDPQPLLTTRHTLTNPLQKSGHGEIVQTPGGEWYLAHLCSRPLAPERRCILGRETAIQKVRWTDDGWLRLESAGIEPQVDVPGPRDTKDHTWPQTPARDDFEGGALSPLWQSLRVPVDESWASLKKRPGWLRLVGRESLHSLFEQSLVAQRLTSFKQTADTCIEFNPAHFTQSAGLICWYDTRTHYYLRITHDAGRGKILGIVLSDDGVYDELAGSDIAVNDWERVYLRGSIDHDKLQFSAGPAPDKMKPIGRVLDASKLSDDYGHGLHFTGALIGLCAQDLNGSGCVADFVYFELR